MSIKKEKKKKSDPTEYEWGLLILIGLLAISAILFLGTTYNNFNNAEARLDKIENSDMFIYTAEYEEVCHNWETNEVYEIIYSTRTNGCDQFCKFDTIEIIPLDSTGESFELIYALSFDWDYTFVDYSIWGNIEFSSNKAKICASCLNQTEPYIHTTEIDMCTEWILVKKLGD